MTDTDTLRTLRTVINRMLCEEEGHDWEPDPLKLEKTCGRCGKTEPTAQSVEIDDSINPNNVPIDLEKTNQCKKFGCANTPMLTTDYCHKHRPESVFIPTTWRTDNYDTANQDAEWTLSSSLG